jgi:hypothetical protein
VETHSSLMPPDPGYIQTCIRALQPASSDKKSY